MLSSMTRISRSDSQILYGLYGVPFDTVYFESLVNQRVQGILYGLYGFYTRIYTLIYIRIKNQKQSKRVRARKSNLTPYNPYNPYNACLKALQINVCRVIRISKHTV